MPKYDLAGNPLPELPSAPPMTDPAGDPIEEVRLGLDGTPLPPLKRPPPENFVPPMRPLTPGPVAAPFSTPPGGGSGPQITHEAASPTDAQSNLGIGLVVGAVAILAALLVLLLLTPKHAAAPTGFTTFIAADKSFSCDAPIGWKTTAADKSQTVANNDSTVNGVLFEEASARIDITTDSVSTLVAANLMKGVADPLTSSKSEALHKQWKTEVSATHKGYTETPVPDFQNQMGEGLLSEWTASGNVFGLGGKIHGYRASLVGGDKTAEVVCQCNESDWPALKPAFLRVIGSVTEGVPAPPTAP